MKYKVGDKVRVIYKSRRELGAPIYVECDVIETSVDGWDYRVQYKNKTTDVFDDCHLESVDPEFERGERVLASGGKDYRKSEELYLFTDESGRHHCARTDRKLEDLFSYGVIPWEYIEKLPSSKPVITIDGRDIDPADYNAAEWAAIREGIVG